MAPDMTVRRIRLPRLALRLGAAVCVAVVGVGLSCSHATERSPTDNEAGSPSGAEKEAAAAALQAVFADCGAVSAITPVDGPGPNPRFVLDTDFGRRDVEAKMRCDNSWSIRLEIRDEKRKLSAWSGATDLPCKKGQEAPEPPFVNAALVCRHGLLPAQNMLLPLDQLLDRLTRTGDFETVGSRLYWTNDGTRFEIQGAVRCLEGEDFTWGMQALSTGKVDLVLPATGRVIDTFNVDHHDRGTCADALKEDSNTKELLMVYVNQFRTTTRAYRVP